MEKSTPSSRLAIRCIRPDLIAEGDRECIEQEMTELGVRLHLAVDDTVVAVDPDVMGPWATVANAIARTHATHVIVPDMRVVEGIEQQIRARAQLISVAAQRIMDAADARAKAKWAAIP